MSAFPAAFPRVLPVRTRRKEQNRLAKQRQREKERADGAATIPVLLTGEEAQLLAWLRKAQTGPEASFYARALVVGAKFCYNSGNVRGGKRRIKGGAAIPAKAASGRQPRGGQS